MRKRDVRGLRGWRSPLPRCEYHVTVSCLRPVVEQDQLDRFVASGGRKLGLDDGVGRLAGWQALVSGQPRIPPPSVISLPAGDRFHLELTRGTHSPYIH